MCPCTLFPHPCPSLTPYFAHPPRAACVLGTFDRPLGPLGSYLCPLHPGQSYLKPCHSQSGVIVPLHPACLGRCRPTKTPPDRDWQARGQRSKHLLRAPHQVGPTQGIPGHVPVHFILPFLYHSRTRFSTATCVHATSLCLGICMYVYIYAGTRRYLQVCVGIYLYVHVPVELEMYVHVPVELEMLNILTSIPDLVKSGKDGLKSFVPTTIN